MEETLLQPMPRWMGDKASPEWTETNHLQGTKHVFKLAQDATGPDGCHGDEVSALRERLQETFLDINYKWIAQECTPESL